MTFDAAAGKIERGTALERADILALAAHPNLTELGMLAHIVRQRAQSAPDCAMYSMGWTAAFSVDAPDPLSPAGDTDALVAGAVRLARARGTEIGLYGDSTHRPALADWETLLSTLASTAETSALSRGMSGADVRFLARSEEQSAEKVLERLRASGLQIVRDEELGPAVADTGQAPFPTEAPGTGLFAAAAAAGLPMTVSIPRTVRSPDQQASLLLKLRQAQEQTGIIRAFVTGPVGRRKLDRPLEPDSGASERWSSFEYLRFLAAARCALHNVPHFQAAWEDQGAKIGQVALRCGADDLGSAGFVNGRRPHERAIVSWGIPPDEMERLIRDAGLTPIRRNGLYEAVAPRPADELPLLQRRSPI